MGHDRGSSGVLALFLALGILIVGGLVALGIVFLHATPTHRPSPALASSSSHGTREADHKAQRLSPNSYRCSGCPSPPAGRALEQDLSLAERAELSVADLGPGWRKIGNPPEASSDKPLGLESPKAAHLFVKCLRLGEQASADVLRNADQVFNLGSPEFSDGNGPSSAIVSSWVDIVRSESDAKADWEVYASPSFPGCASFLFNGLLGGDSLSRTVSGSGSRTPPASPSISVKRIMVNLPNPARGAVLTVFTPRGARYLALLVVNRLETTCSLEGTPPGGAEAFLEHLLGRLASRDIAVTRALQ
jgi:hypothetical protein